MIRSHHRPPYLTPNQKHKTPLAYLSNNQSYLPRYPPHSSNSDPNPPPALAALTAPSPLGYLVLRLTVALALGDTLAAAVTIMAVMVALYSSTPCFF